MYITDPFQFSAMSFKLTSMLVENQLRVAKVLADAAMTPSPLWVASVPRRDTSEVTPSVKRTAVPKPKVVRANKDTTAAKTTAKKTRAKSVPKTVKEPAIVAHPAE